MNAELNFYPLPSDLAIEAEFLSSLQHPHVIKIRGIALSGTNGFARGPTGYFLIIDYLDETLDCRINKWRKKKLGRRKSITNALFASSIKRVNIRKNRDANDDGGVKSLITEEQLNVALQIAASLKYLHEQRIVFRDLKPANIGFDGKHAIDSPPPPYFVLSV